MLSQLLARFIFPNIYEYPPTHTHSHTRTPHTRTHTHTHNQFYYLFLSNLYDIQKPSIVNLEFGKFESILVSVSTKILIFSRTSSFN